MLSSMSSLCQTQFAENGSLRDYAVLAHGVKGAARTIGAGLVAGLAEELEKAGKAGNGEYVRKNHAAFITKTQALLESLDAIDAVDAVDAVGVIEIPQEESA